MVSPNRPNRAVTNQNQTVTVIHQTAGESPNRRPPLIKPTDPNWRTRGNDYLVNHTNNLQPHPLSGNP